MLEPKSPGHERTDEKSRLGRRKSMKMQSVHSSWFGITETGGKNGYVGYLNDVIFAVPSFAN